MLNKSSLPEINSISNKHIFEEDCHPIGSVLEKASVAVIFSQKVEQHKSNRRCYNRDGSLVVRIDEVVSVARCHMLLNAVDPVALLAFRKIGGSTAPLVQVVGDPLFFFAENPCFPV